MCLFMFVTLGEKLRFIKTVLIYETIFGSGINEFLSSHQKPNLT